MKRLVVLSPFDCEYYDSTRTHHVVAQLRHRFDEVVLFHRRLPAGADSSRWARLAGFFRLRRGIRQDGNVVRVAVTPLFARPDGMTLSLMHVADPYEPVVNAPRRLVMSLLSVGGLALDLFCVPSYLYAYLRQGAPRSAVILAQGPWEFLVARILQILGRTSRVAYDDLDYVPGSYSVSGLKRRVMRGLENYCIRRADIVISVGDLLADLRRHELGRVVPVVPNGADIAKFAGAQSKREHPPTLIYVGSVLAWSGVDLAIAALDRIRKRIPEARLLVVGHSPLHYQAHLEKLCDDHGVRGCVHFLGKKTQDEIVGLLAKSDIGLAVFRPVELRKYAFSLKIIEYMAAGLPVLTTAGTQSERVVVKHGCGLAVGYTVEAVADAALRLLGNREYADAMALRGVQASAAYDWETLMLEQLYPALAGVDGPSPSSTVPAATTCREPPAG